MMGWIELRRMKRRSSGVSPDARHLRRPAMLTPEVTAAGARSQWVDRGRAARQCAEGRVDGERLTKNRREREKPPRGNGPACTRVLAVGR